jgi:tetratricopeptide (TPR) repeat protein
VRLHRLLVPLLALLLAVTVLSASNASAARAGVRLTAPGAVEVGQRTVLTVRVTPARAKRPVVVQRKSGKRWVTVGSGRTDRKGSVRIATSFPTAGRVTMRATARAHRGQRARTATTVVTVRPKAPGTVELGVDGGTAMVGQPSRLVARVRPAQAGRTVEFQRQQGSGWAAIGRATTDRTGIAALRTTFAAAGPVRVRAVAIAYAGRGAATSPTVTVTVRSTPPPPLDDEFPRDGELSVQTPDWVLTGSVFDVRLPVTATTAIESAALVVTPPGAGERVTPPDELTAVAGGLGTTVTGLAAGATRTPVLRWRAPLAPGELTVRARLTVGGVVRELSAKIRVVPEPSGGEVFTDALEIWREGREAPVDPERVKDFPPRSLGTRPIPTYADALAAATTYVESRFDESQRAAWQEFLAVQDPEVIDDVLVTAFASNHAVAALAIALRGHELAPNDPVHLSNAAVAANGLDRPEWAIAFGRRAGELPPGPAVGIDQEAVRLTNVAHAWALMGDYGNAEQHLRRALLHAPQNPLVHEELAAVVQFRSGKEAALPHVRRSLRKTDDADPLEDHADQAPYRFSRVPASDIFDLSRGLQGGLMLPELPDTLEELSAGDGWMGYWDQQEDALFARLRASYAESTATLAEFRELDLHPIARQRALDVLRHISADGDLAVWEAYLEVRAATYAALSPNGCQDVFPDHAYCDYNGSETSCGSSRAVFAEWRRRIGRWYAAIREYHRVAWPVFTGLQAQLSDPVAFKLAGLSAQEQLLGLMYPVVTNVNSTGFAMPREEGCDGSDPLDDPQEADLDASDPVACAPDSDISKLAFEVDLLVTKFKASCEKFSLESSLGAYGFLEGYAKYEQGWKANGATIFVGGKAQIPSVASFDSVVYLETDGQGGVKDVGLEVGPEVEIGGSIKLTTYSDKIRMSAMSLFVGE